MRTANLLVFLIVLLLNEGCSSTNQQSGDDMWSLASARKSDLRLGVYVTAQTVEQLFTTEGGRREAISVLK